jgi:hypothetical protein
METVKEISSEKPVGRKGRFRIVSPLMLLILAILIIVGFAAAHAAGWRENVSLLTGTSFDASDGEQGQIASASVYVLLYFAAVIVSPIFALASGIMWFLQRALKRRKA